MPTRPAPTAPTTVPRVWHPVGELPARVYWRRRVLALVVLVVVVALVVWGATALVGALAAGY